MAIILLENKNEPLPYHNFLKNNYEKDIINFHSKQDWKLVEKRVQQILAECE